MNRKYCIIILTFIALFYKKAVAQEALEFIENKGQWQSQMAFKANISTGAVAISKHGGYRMLLHSEDDLQAIRNYIHPSLNAATNSVSKAISSALTLRGHVYELKFLQSNPNPQIEALKPLPTFNNYILRGNAKQWVGHCNLYQTIVVKNIYPGIDIRYYSGNQSLKYDFIVHPGANPNQIIMYYDGVDAISQRSNQLHLQTSVKTMHETIPSAYTVGVEKQEVSVQFKVKSSFVSFEVAAYDTSKTLIIDPAIIFSTFTGSGSDNWGYTATYDNAGNFYAGGIVFGNEFPISNGAFQSTFKGGQNTGEDLPFDIGIMKFNPSGSRRLFATYIGGSGNEQPHSLICDATGNVIISGRTTSRDFPTTGSSLGNGGGWDIFLAKLSADGSQLIGSRVLGGSADDGVNIRHKYVRPAGAESTRRNYGDDSRSEVIIDSAQNIILASCTQSTDFPVLNALQPTSGGVNANGRMQDGVLIKANANLSSILFSTFLGGKDDDAAFVLAIHSITKNIYVGGATASSDFPGSKSQVLFDSLQGDVDGFLSIIKPDGSAILKSTYVGTSSTDVVYGLQFDKFGKVYICGTSKGNWPIVKPSASGNFFSQPTGKQFISKLEPDFSKWIYSTCFGTGVLGMPNISITAMLVDRCENVYVSGWGGAFNAQERYDANGTRLLPITSDAFQKTTDGSDFYFFVLERDATRQLYGSYFGQAGGLSDHVDGGTSRFDKNGIIYQSICANCGGQASFPTTPGVWAPTNGALGKNGGQCNLAAIKIAIDLAGIVGGIKSTVKSELNSDPPRYFGCVPLTATFLDTIKLAKNYVWDFGDNSGLVKSSNSTITHTFNQIGTFQVKMISVDSNSCNVTDTSITYVKVRNQKATPVLEIRKIDTCTQFRFVFDISKSIPATNTSFNKQSFTLYFGDGTSRVMDSQQVVHQYLAPGTYKVHLVLTDTNFCNAPDTIEQELRIAEFLKANIGAPPFGCIPSNIAFQNLSNGGQFFEWNFGDGSAPVKQSQPTHNYTDTGTYTIRLIANDTFTCNQFDTAYFIIKIYPKPSSAFTATPQPPLENKPIYFTNNSVGATNYVWDFDDNQKLFTNRDTVVSFLFNTTKYYSVKLIAINQFGCADTSQQFIKATINPLFDVPTAFTPNGNGVNDKLYVRGFGIKTFDWKILNRWGQVIYTSQNMNDGWDGTLSGNPQPMDVYHYILNITTTDGKKVSKEGSVTLIR